MSIKSQAWPEVQNCIIFFKKNKVSPKLDVSLSDLFFESEFGSTKNSGSNPWSVQFWGYPRLGPRAKLAPSQNWRLDPPVVRALSLWQLLVSLMIAVFLAIVSELYFLKRPMCL